MSPGVKFVGNFPRSLDVKGRVIIPSRLRLEFKAFAYLTPGEDGCLALWPEEDFELEADRQRAKDALGAQARNDLRDWTSLVTRIEFDRQGRMAVPPELRSVAALEQEVLFVGVLDRVELWSPSVWANRRSAAVRVHSSPSPVDA